MTHYGSNIAFTLISSSYIVAMFLLLFLRTSLGEGHKTVRDVCPRAIAGLLFEA